MDDSCNLICWASSTLYDFQLAAASYPATNQKCASPIFTGSAANSQLLQIYFCTRWLCLETCGYLFPVAQTASFKGKKKNSVSPRRLVGCPVALSHRQTNTLVSHSLVLLLFDLLADLWPRLGWAGWTFGPAPAPTGHSYSHVIRPPSVFWASAPNISFILSGCFFDSFVCFC